MRKEMLHWVLPLLFGTVTIYGRRILPRLESCPVPGCPRFFLVKHREVACSPEHAASVRFERYTENLKQAPGAYEAYLSKKKKEQKKRRRKKKQQKGRSPRL